MAEEDEHLIRIAPKFTWLVDNLKWPRPEGEIGLSAERWAAYRKLFEEAGVPSGLARKDSMLYFLVETCGIVGSGRTNGYVYSESSPLPLLESLRDLEEEGIGYVPIERNWYLFAERD